MWLRILANSDPNFVISEISVNQVKKCFHALGVGVFTIQEQSCNCDNRRRFLRILANFASGQSHASQTGELLEWNQVYNLVADELYRPPMVALRRIFGKSIWSSCVRFTFADLLTIVKHLSALFPVLWPSPPGLCTSPTFTLQCKFLTLKSRNMKHLRLICIWSSLGIMWKPCATEV